MNDETTVFALSGRHAGQPAPVLAHVQATGRLDGVLFELRLRQTYRNTSERMLEVVYTFPLPHGAVLLGFASELNGRRKSGAIVAKRQAERQYEEALSEGNTPVMLEAGAGGLHTANLGNLQPGDELVLETRFAQLLRFEQGRLRLSIPTTLAPRYGHPSEAGLQPQQAPVVSMLAEYPLTLSVTLAGSLGRATVECPTHRFNRVRVEGGQRLDLAQGAWLDRDVVLLVTPKEPRPSLVVLADDTMSASAPLVVMAVLPLPPAAQRAQIALKLLVDCSGSMAGDSMGSARLALLGAVQQLSGEDEVSFSRFGSTVEHVLLPARFRAASVNGLRAAVAATEANLGGTKMEQALAAVFKLPVAAATGSADVLLITDGQVWNANEMVAAARASRHRVFAIGVGSAPAESVLSQLAEATGGACEFATPGEALEAAAARMMQRIRQPAVHALHIDWGREPAWQTPCAQSVFAGDTVLVMAGFASTSVPKRPVRLLGTDAVGGQTELACGEATAPCPGDSLARMAAAQRLVGADAATASELALRYQLMSPHTHCVLVHERAQAERAAEAATLHRVQSMMAAGWGATSTVSRAADASYCLSASAMDRAWVARETYQCAEAPTPDLSCADVPFAFLSRSTAQVAPASLRTLALAVAHHWANGGTPQDLAAQCTALTIDVRVSEAQAQTRLQGLTDDVFWLLLAHWVLKRTDGQQTGISAAVLEPWVRAIDSELQARAREVFERELGHVDLDRWEPARSERLRQALREA